MHSVFLHTCTWWTWGGASGLGTSASTEIFHSKCLVWWHWEVVTQINPVFGLMVSSCHSWKGVGVNPHICHRVCCDTPSASFLCKTCCFLLKTVKTRWRQTGRQWYITTAEMTNYNISLSDSSGKQWKKLSFGRQASLNTTRKRPSGKCIQGGLVMPPTVYQVICQAHSELNCSDGVC